MKIKSILWIMSTLILFTYSCTKKCEESGSQGLNTELSGELKSIDRPIAVPKGDPYTKAQVDEIVKRTHESNGDFRWEMAEFELTWSAIQYGEQAVAVGYQPHNAGDISESIHTINIHAGAWKEVHDAIIDLVVQGLKDNGRSPLMTNDLIIEDDQTLPIITFKLTDKNVLTTLRNLKNVRYIEPLDYAYGDLSERSTSGCGESSQALNTSDYTITTPNALLPWNFASNNIAESWNSPDGQGITIGIIDAGINSSQTLLGSQFNSGESNVGRTVTTDFTFGNSAFTSCTHGTSMSGLAVGPKNSLGATTGVSFKANLHFIRGCEDVVLNKASERTGVKNALVKMGDRNDVKIVSMSIGSPFYSSVLEDGVNYAHGKGKMLMAAAGTSFSWTSWWGVVYPAALTKCVAVTGVKENGNTCSSCHDGSQVDFTITMERSSNSNRNSLSIGASGTSPKYIGGSSAATAIAAGIAANVWSVNPNLSRDQVYNYLLITSQNYPGTNSYLGYGNLNGGAAVTAAQQAL